ncbi:outer membrane protein assembly factor BamE [uncultured Lentibacter sp.]|uniref:outer membrane protein assembly factor BamE n=1 Tax=uncultured Lentibacter sp. TaxID=1659309 RepID=UPI00262E6881|nr:outer membrane protein assembly factor BamE [uncultured Lentibacter sp.]
MKAITHPIKHSVAYLLLGLVFMALSSCAATYRDHGYMPPESDLAEIVVGVDSRDSVAEAVGLPSTSGVLTEGGYYYVKSRVRFFGALRPKEIERQVLAISFTPAGIVQNIERFSLEDGKVVTLSRRVTDQTVRDDTFLRQLLGSIGRFSPGAFE